MNLVENTGEAYQSFKIEFPFGILMVDEDIYYRIIKNKNIRPKFKKLNCFYFCHGIVRCCIASGRKSYSLGRLLLLPQKNEIVDHINRAPLDNRRCNLRIVNARQNTLNVIIKNNTGLIGVSSRIHRGKRQLRAAFRTLNGRRLAFYIYDSPSNRIICALARDKFVIQSGDEEYAPLNFPIFKNEPFRSELLKMDINEFRKDSIKLFIKKLGVNL